MLRIAVIVISTIGVVVFLVLGVFSFVPLQISAVMIPAFIGVGSLVLTYLSKEKAHAKETQTSEKAATEQPELPKPYVLVNETNAINRGDYLSYDLGELDTREEIKGEISSDEPVNFYFLTKYSLDRFENNEDFSFDYGSERCLKSSVSFTPSRATQWFLAVRNVGKKQAKVHVYLYIES